MPHTYLNIFFAEITGLFDGLFIRLFRSLDQNGFNLHVVDLETILALLRRSGERLRTFKSSSFIWPYIYQMEVLENLEVERQQIDRVNELLKLKDSLQQKLTQSTIKQVIMNFLS